MNKTIADAYKELKGDLGNIKDADADDKYVFFNRVESRFTSRIEERLHPDWCEYICTVEQFNNYKDDDVKTVLDAVIDLSGYWSDNEEMVVVRFSSVWSFTDYMPPLERSKSFTRDEFNTLVDELSTNFGRSSFKHLAIWQAELKESKETKVDYTSEEFWKDAPDGATGHSEDNECYGECWYKNITSESFYCMPVSSGIWIHSFDTWQLERRGVITRPKPQPVFTKEFAIKGGANIPLVWKSCEVVYSGSRYTVVKTESGKEYSRKTAKLNIRDIDTRTDKEKAIDDHIDSQEIELNEIGKISQGSFRGWREW